MRITFRGWGRLFWFGLIFAAVLWILIRAGGCGINQYRELEQYRQGATSVAVERRGR